MCVAVPKKIVRIEGNLGWVECDGGELDVGLDMLEDVRVGDYVIIHAGYAIHQVSQEEAEESLAIFARIQDALDRDDRSESEG